jgi:hypothetical protein
VNTVIGIAYWLLPVNRAKFAETQGALPRTSRAFFFLFLKHRSCAATSGRAVVQFAAELGWIGGPLSRRPLATSGDSRFRVDRVAAHFPAAVETGHLSGAFALGTL